MRVNFIIKCVVVTSVLILSNSYSKNKNNNDKTDNNHINSSSFENSISNISIDDLRFGPQHIENKGKVLDDIVAIVGNDVITLKEVKDKNKDLQNKKLQELIYRKLLLQEAKKYNIQVGDTAVNLKLEEIAAQNKLTLAQLQKKIESKSSFAKYRDDIQTDLIIARLQQVIANQFVKITNREVEDYVEQHLRQVNDSVDLEDVLIRVPQSINEVEFEKAKQLAEKVFDKLKTQSPQAVSAELDGVEYNKLGWVALKQIPVSFAKALINLPVKTYAKPVIDQDGIHILKVLDRRGNEQAGNVNYTETKVSHILIKNNDDAKSRIDSVYKKLISGEDFAQIARNYSEDSGSAVRGGDLDWVTPGRMVPEFDAVMKKTPIGKISQPFKTQFGWHVLYVHDVREISLSNDETLKQQAKQIIFQNRASEEWQLWLTRLRDESYVKLFDN